MIEYTSTLNGSPSGLARRQALLSIGSVASMSRASFRSLALKAATARPRLTDLVFKVIDPSYPAPRAAVGI